MRRYMRVSWLHMDYFGTQQMVFVHFGICYYLWAVSGYLLLCMGSVGLFAIIIWVVWGYLLLYVWVVSGGLFAIMYG